MVENLKVTHYNNGNPIPQLTDDGDWTSTNDGAYCYYDNSSANGETYGALYNWYAVEEDSTRGLAPEGWHVPTDEEIMELEMYLGMTYEEAHDTGWRGTNEGSKLAGNANLWTNGALENDPEFGSSGFDFLPGGCRGNTSGYFYGLGNDGKFWSATENSTSTAWSRSLNYTDAQVGRSNDGKRNGFSVRCVRD
ncbi:MAG: fibrobacter succinogenes major paralogous domain-containing protein [Candidatus Cloacimonetes bacterium]|nr:fibrobacter succinogenes major paralogous domain-containing protein [Candidatus Cloacimonadota bacterium]